MAGAMQTFTAQFNGGPLGGTASFQKYTTEVRSYTPILSFGANTIGSQPMTVLMGLSARAGTVIGDPGPFFSSQSFALGGTQYGEPLRGYCEFAITPSGYDASACDGQAKRASFGNAFFVGTAELGFRLNQAMYINAFMDAGNVWAKPREFDPTRLFRSVGIGGSTLSPLGPLGLDFAYGLDRLDASGRKNPGWKVHFKFGQTTF
jgi:outer membrane protein insertion porin family